MGNNNYNQLRDYIIKVINASFDAINKINDENILFEIAKNENYDDICKAAISKITNESNLGYLIENKGVNVRRYAIDKLQEINPNSILLMSKDDVGNVNSEKELLKIFNSSTNIDARREAVKKINNQDVLMDIAESETDNQIIKAAMGGIKDESVILNFFLNRMC